MMVISEIDLGIVCDSKSCTRQAHYVVTVNAPTPWHGLYCPQCSATLLQWAARVLNDTHDERQLADFITSQPLIRGMVIHG